MKKLKQVLTGAIILLLVSCATTAKFPVSNITPAAEISAKMKQDKNKNYVIEVTARNLSGANRLNPPMNNYVVWIMTEENGTKNIGQLISRNTQKSYLKTSSPFLVKEIFITAEKEGNISHPSNYEISRTSF